MKRILALCCALTLTLTLAACTQVTGPTVTAADTTTPAATEVSTNTAAPTAEPTAEPTTEPAAAPKAATAIAVTDEKDVVTVAGQSGGATLWSREFKIENHTELAPWSEATLAGGVAYLQVDYHMMALDTITGATLWISDASGGLCKPVVFEGVVYTCSYYGEPLIGMSAEDGCSIFAVEPFQDYFWPYAVELSGETLTVRFDSTGIDSDKKGTATFSLAGELLSKKAD